MRGRQGMRLGSTRDEALESRTTRLTLKFIAAGVHSDHHFLQLKLQVVNPPHKPTSPSPPPGVTRLGTVIVMGQRDLECFR